MNLLPFSIFLAVPLLVFDATRPGVWRVGRVTRGTGVALLVVAVGTDWARLVAGGVAALSELLVWPAALVVGLAVVLGEHLATTEESGYWRRAITERRTWKVGAEIGAFVAVVALNLATWVATESVLDPAWRGGLAAVARTSLTQFGWALGETAFYSAYLTLTLRAKLRGHAVGATLAVIGGALIFTFQHVAGPWTAWRYLAIFPAGVFLAVIFLRRGFWVATLVHWLLTLAATGAAAVWAARL